MDNPLQHCPLCYATLTSANEQPELQSYPDLQEKARKYNLIYRILFTLSLTVGSICLTANLLIDHTNLWSLVVIGNIAYMWVAIGTALNRHARMGFIILIQAMSLSALLVLIDWMIGHRNWALNYVVPFCFITATLSITIIIIVKRMRYQEFILYFILTALLGFIPIILMAAGLVTVLWPSLVSALYAGLSLAGFFIFADSAVKVELRKRFHI